uniref:Uncharacterized protein n=1 Tax=Timema poppense TaxID=170557 RepID=A0A7R9HG05_TIMPO|nr:unnamed protein product [Timema poppensis]
MAQIVSLRSQSRTRQTSKRQLAGITKTLLLADERRTTCAQTQSQAYNIFLLAGFRLSALATSVHYSSCLLWDASCGEKGNCWLYQKDKFRIYMNVTAAVLTSLGVILDIKVWHLGKTLDLYGDTDEHSSDDRRRSSAYRSRQVSLANRSRQPSLANRSRQPSIADRSRQGSVSDRSRRPSFVDSSGRPSVQNSRQPSLGNTSYKNSATDSSSIVDFSKNLSADDRPRTPSEQK